MAQLAKSAESHTHTHTHTHLCSLSCSPTKALYSTHYTTPNLLTHTHTLTDILTNTYTMHIVYKAFLKYDTVRDIQPILVNISQTSAY